MIVEGAIKGITEDYRRSIGLILMKDIGSKYLVLGILDQLVIAGPHGYGCAPRKQAGAPAGGENPSQQD
nr:hypothetical protein L321_03421 [Pseudomonas plecoglossicida NB2011]